VEADLPPASLRRFLCRLANVVRPGRRGDDELARELSSHLGLLEDEYRRRGLPPDQAQRAAKLALGGVERTKDLHRSEASFVWLEDARRDATYAVRLLRRNPTMAATAVLSIAIGIGANSAVFTVANALLFRSPTGVPDPERLVDIGVSRDDGGFNPGSYPTFLDVRRRSTTLEGVFAHVMFPHAMSLAVDASGGADRVFGYVVSSNYFSVLGVRPVVGHFFGVAAQPSISVANGRSEVGLDLESRDAVIVLSYRLWVQRFNQDPAIVGRTVQIDGLPVSVAGIAPDRFQGTGIVAPDLWLPLSTAAVMDPQRKNMFTERGGGWLVMGGRLKPGVPLSRASAELDSIGQNLRQEYPDQMGRRGLRLGPSSSVPGNRGLVAAFFGLLTGIVSLVLLVACANVSGVLLARAAARRREVAIRLSIGAGRARLVRQLLMETTVLFVLAGAVGVGLARVATSLLVASLPALPFPVAVSLPLDGRVVVFTALLTLVAALLSGLAPAVRASKTDPVAELKTDSHGVSGGSRLRRMLVVAQVAFSLTLVLSAGLFMRALQRAGTLDPGYDPQNVELTPVDLTTSRYTDVNRPQFFHDLITRVRQIPGVQAATAARVVPGGFEGLGLALSVPGAPPAEEDSFEPDGNIVEPGYFATLRIPLIAGRDFTDTDRAGAQPVAIVGETAARHYWPGQNALGKYLLHRIEKKDGGSEMLLVVGVARDIKSTSLIDGLSESFVYLPLQQQSSALTSSMLVVTRTTDGRGANQMIRRLIAAMDPGLTIATSQTLNESVALGLVPQRIAATVSGSLGAIGLLLAALGIYGVTAFTVIRRTHEFGLRVALGAAPRDILHVVLREGMSLTVIGAAIGLTLGAGVGRILTAFLFGLPPLDPVTFVGASVLFIGTGLAAGYGPARHATKVDPLIALRHE
jgi:predicted permease